ncbi:MAG: bifunctional riboflavin kinase/FAD synthetase [Prevotella sp.]|nr:bifunctional riboflavin kinase/FAD synthetase [Prevotella sp.]
MNTIVYTPDLHLDGHFAATIGCFDGLHRGHQHLLRQLADAAAVRGQRTLVVTFDRHPRQTLQPAWQPQLITTLAERQALLDETGIDTLVILPFTVELARLTAHEFMGSILRNRLSVSTLLTGYDNRFGCRTAHDDGLRPYDDYRRYGATIGLDVLLAEPLIVDGEAVSSSRVRRLLGEGSVRQAARCLGRPYTLAGRVVHGDGIGRTLGFPTANLAPDDPCKLIPRPGVYAVSVGMVCDGERQYRPAVMNIGTRPTFGSHNLTLEVYVLDFSADLYGQELTVAFHERLRNEQHFDGVEALRQQLEADAEEAKEVMRRQLVTDAEETKEVMRRMGEEDVSPKDGGDLP